METEKYDLIGLMSGTSGDGLDLAFCRFHWNGTWNYEIVKANTVGFADELGEKLRSSHLLSALDLAILDVDFGRWMGLKVKEFCEAHGFNPMAVASHGHTVFHQPQIGLSLQIGNGWALHQACGEKVINDFRMLDVQLGGQGAPLVPVGDKLLFPKADFCINLGGISNISMESQGDRIAFDCSPFNLLLNEQANRLGKTYDDGGKIARIGRLDVNLFEKLNQLPFYQRHSSKSLGREDLEKDFCPLIQNSGLNPQDLLRTLVEHYAFQLATIIKKHQSSGRPTVLITGGGAYNLFFVERLDSCLKGNWDRFPATKELIEFKEAMIFAFLGVLRLRSESNCLASVTGAERDNCGGVIYG
jgi:anhydro-N-acetylmuramic acid kinase